jgi:hypothetical protein
VAARHFEDRVRTTHGGSIACNIRAESRVSQST